MNITEIKTLIRQMINELFDPIPDDIKLTMVEDTVTHMIKYDVNVYAAIQRQYR